MRVCVGGCVGVCVCALASVWTRRSKRLEARGEDCCEQVQLKKDKRRK